MKELSSLLDKSLIFAALTVVALLVIIVKIQPASDIKKVLDANEAALAPAQPAPSDFTTQGRQVYGVARPEDFSRPDPGNFIDLDGDQINDYVLLVENRLTWHKGRGDGTFAAGVCIITVKEFCRGYYVRVLPGHNRPTFQFWDKDLREFRQECAGVRNGVPLFNDAEAYEPNL